MHVREPYTPWVQRLLDYDERDLTGLEFLIRELGLPLNPTTPSANGFITHPCSRNSVWQELHRTISTKPIVRLAG